MIDEHDLFVRAAERFDPPHDALERLMARRTRRARRQRVGAAVVAIVLVVAVFGGIAFAIRAANRVEPVTPPQGVGIFDPIRGWIVVNTRDGLVAVNPDDLHETRAVSDVAGSPAAWSRDGSELLLSGRFTGGPPEILHSDGSVQPLRLPSDAWPGSFTPDGSELLYTSKDGIDSLDVATGATRVLVAGHPSTGTGFGSSPQLSPDGHTIAIERVVHKHDRGIWAVNLNGSGLRRLVSPASIAAIYGNPRAFQDWLMGTWSPDGSQLTFNVDGHDCFIVAAVNADGSGLRRITPVHGRSLSPTWSPDGTRIAATDEAIMLQVMDANGAHVRTVHVNPVPPPLTFAAWNPLPPLPPSPDPGG